MPTPLKLSKSDVRRRFVNYHLAKTDLRGAFNRLRSVQFDPIAPVGCNHDLVLQSRVPDYKIGDWNKAAYEERFLYDGWDKQACLIRFDGWNIRRVIYDWHRKSFDRIFEDHAYAVDEVRRELTDRGPLLPKEFTFQEKKPDWRGSWHGPNLTKQTLRALWHAGEVMTYGRRGGHHVYDLTERVVPSEWLNAKKPSEEESVRQILLERHHAMGVIRPTAAYEVWSMDARVAQKKLRTEELIGAGELVPVDIEGIKANTVPAFLAHLGEPLIERRVSFIAPLDQLVWDRKMIHQLFGFEYKWEIYVPESKRVWGYYVLPVLFGDEFVARVEFYFRKGSLELKVWHWEAEPPKDSPFWAALDEAAVRFCRYCGAVSVEGNAPKAVLSAFKRAVKQT
ncbi:MAG: crosslink repair DNA glycosylase YcaQ family protein [Fimbriimonadaceae bacterium]